MLLFASRLSKDDELRDGKKLSSISFILQQNDVVLWESPLSFFLSLEQMSCGRVEFFCPSGLFELTRRPSGQKNSTLPQDICSSFEKKKLNGLSLRTTSFCFRIKEMEKVFCHPSVSPSLYNLLANKNPCFYFPAPLHYFPPPYFQLNPYSKYHIYLYVWVFMKT